MKKFIAAFSLLICAVVVLLATVDLAQYLAPDKATTQVTNNQSRASCHDSRCRRDRTDTTETNGRSNEHSVSGATCDEIFPEQQRVVMAPPTKIAAVAEEEVAQIPSPPIELEVTTLPVGDYPFSILLATFQEKETAQRAVSVYRKRGISAYWVKVELDEMRIRYRLFTGIFSTMPEARQYLEQSELVDKLIKPTYYAARLGVYTDKTELAATFTKADQAGVMPYILGTTKGDYYLYVGAFYTFVGAVDQCRDLAAAGLSCKPVKRSTVPPQ